jgi:hypothetical protein
MKNGCADCASIEKLESEMREHEGLKQSQAYQQPVRDSHFTNRAHEGYRRRRSTQVKAGSQDFASRTWQCFSVPVCLSCLSLSLPHAPSLCLIQPPQCIRGSPPSSTYSLSQLLRSSTSLYSIHLKSSSVKTRSTINRLATTTPYSLYNQPPWSCITVSSSSRSSCASRSITNW